MVFRQLNEKRTMDDINEGREDTIHERRDTAHNGRLHSNSSYHDLYSRNIESRKDNLRKKPPAS